MQRFKHLLWLLLVPAVAFAAPTTNYFLNIAPTVTDTYNSGTSALEWLNTYTKYASTTALSASSLISGNCIQASTGGLLTTIGTPCGSGSGTVTQINTTAPIQGGPITTTGTISITQSGSATDGYLSSIDWNLFNNKVSSSSLFAQYPFPLTGNATSTLTQFNGGLTAYASSTIGNGSSGLTVNGTATTTGRAYFAGNVGIGSATPFYPLEVVSATANQAYFSSTGANNANILLNSAAGNQSDFALQSAGATKWLIGKQTDDSFFLYDMTNARDAVRVSTVGNVLLSPAGGNTGVGTTSPYKLFSVGGDVVVGASTAGGTLGDLYLPKLGTAAGTFLAADANGKVIATTTTSSGITGLGPVGQIQTGATQTIASSTTGTDFTITASGNTQTFNLPVASAVNTGKLSSTDWTTFNNKQNALTLPLSIANGGTATTTFYNGGVTFYNSTLGTLSQATSTSGLFFDNITSRLGIGTATPGRALEVANGLVEITGTQTVATGATGMFEVAGTITDNSTALSAFRARPTFNGSAAGAVMQGLDVVPTFAPSGNITIARGGVLGGTFSPPTGVTITDAIGIGWTLVYANVAGAVTNGTIALVDSPIIQGALKPITQYGVHVKNQGLAGITTAYGLYVDPQSGATNNYAGIFESGNVGIATTTPQWNLEIASSTKSQLTLSDAAATANLWSLRSAGGSLYFATSSPSTFATSSVSALSINTNGVVNIPNLARAAGTFVAADTTGNLIATTSPLLSLIGTQGQVDYFSGTNTAQGTSTLFITPASRVGLGTVTPTDVNANAHLTVAGIGSQDIIASTTDNTTLSDAILQAYAPGSRVFLGAHGTSQVSSRYGITLGGWGELGAFNSTSGTTNGLIIGTNPAVPIVFGTNNLERMRIDSTGYVGIGTTSPWETLSVNGGLVVTGTMPTLIGTPTPTTSTFTAFNANSPFYAATTTTSSGIITATVIADYEGSTANTTIQGFNAAGIWGTGATVDTTNAVGGVRGGRYGAMNVSVGHNVTNQAGILSACSVIGTLASTTNCSAIIAEAPGVTTGNLITNAYGFLGRTAAVTGTLTSQAGIAIPALTVATNNTLALFGTVTIPTGNYGIYDSSANNNYFAGNTGIGTTTPYATLSIQSGASTGDAFVVATTTGKAIGGYDNDGHVFTSGPAPVISSCGTGSGTVVGDDQSGTITTATAATACTATFSKAYRGTPVCTVTDNSLVGFADISSISTTAVTFGISSALTGGLLYYQCAYHRN